MRDGLVVGAMGVGGMGISEMGVGVIGVGGMGVGDIGVVGDLDKHVEATLVSEALQETVLQSRRASRAPIRRPTA